MGDYLILHIFVDRDKNMILVPYKECSAGYAVASEPYEKYSAEEWENAAIHIIKMADEAAKQPIAEDTEGNVMNQVCGKKGFKQFSKKHICIAITYQIREKKFIISNYPRLPDGSYGSEKGSISEMFSVAYESSKDAALIQENFLKAYRDGKAYLEKIGSEL